MENENSHLATLRPAERLVVELCRRASAFHSEEISLEPLRSPEVADQVIALGQRHNVLGLILVRLQELLPEEFLPVELRSRLFAPLSQSRRQAVLWDMEQRRVLTLLAGDGIHPVLLKGGALRATVYGTPVERSMGDIDLLVEREEVEGLITALGKVGYGSKYPEGAREGFGEHHYHYKVTHSNGFVVEVHWGLTRPGSVFRLDPALFLERARLLDRPGWPSVRIPSYEDMLLHSVSQSQVDGIQRLRRIVDLDRIIAAGDVDWNDVRVRAQKARLSSVLAVTARLANITMGTPIPAPILRGEEVGRLARVALGAMRPLTRLVREPSMAHATSEVLFLVWCTPSWRARMKMLAARLSGVGDPLQWIWDWEQGRETRLRGRLGGVVSVLKLLWLQGAILMPRRRTRYGLGPPGLSFWERP